jgi:hypothetical protein
LAGRRFAVTTPRVLLACALALGLAFAIAASTSAASVTSVVHLMRVSVFPASRDGNTITITVKVDNGTGTLSGTAVRGRSHVRLSLSLPDSLSPATRALPATRGTHIIATATLSPGTWTVTLTTLAAPGFAPATLIAHQIVTIPQPKKKPHPPGTSPGEENGRTG